MDIEARFFHRRYDGFRCHFITFHGEHLIGMLRIDGPLADAFHFVEKAGDGSYAIAAVDICPEL